MSNDFKKEFKEQLIFLSGIAAVWVGLSFMILAIMWLSITLTTLIGASADIGAIIGGILCTVLSVIVMAYVGAKLTYRK